MSLLFVFHEVCVRCLFVSMCAAQHNLLGITLNPPRTPAEVWAFHAKGTYWRGRPFWTPVNKVQWGSAVALCPRQRITHCSQWAEQPSVLHQRAKWKISGYRCCKDVTKVIFSNSSSFIKEINRNEESFSPRNDTKDKIILWNIISNERLAWQQVALID